MKKEYQTRERNLILDYLKEHSDQSFQAKDILDYINSGSENINRATVYRNLERLCTQGKLIKFKKTDTDGTFYQFTDSHEHCDRHLHAQCVECGKIFHLEEQFVDEFESKMSAIYGIEIDPSHTVIADKCEECKAENHTSKHHDV